MGVALDKLLSYNENKYIFSKAAMKAIEKMSNVKDYEEGEEKIVIKTLNLLLEGKIKFDYDAEK